MCNSCSQVVASGEALGNTTNSASTSCSCGCESKKKIQHAYRLLDAAQHLFERENHRVCMCSKIRIDIEKPIDVTVDRENGRASYGNIAKCGNVWACPVCSRKISEERREEVQTAINEWRRRGNLVAMMTNTISHNIGDALQDVKTLFSKAWRSYTGGRGWADFCDEWSYHGRIRVIEITYGMNGWHLHAHTILFLEVSPDYDISPMRHELKTRWMKAVQRHGGHANYENGCDITVRENDISDYVTKHGRLPSDIEEKIEASAVGWTESHELAKAVTKNAKTEDGRTPFRMLQDYAELGDKRAGALFVEYVRAMKNQKQLEWSKGLKNDLLNGEHDEKSDEEVAEEVDTEVVAQVEKDVWRHIIRQRARGRVLAAALEGDEELVQVLHEIKDGVYFVPGVVRKECIGNHRVYIGRGKHGFVFACWDMSNKQMRPPDYQSRVGVGSELEALFVASRWVSHQEKNHGR